MNRVISIGLNNFKNQSRVIKESMSLKNAGYDVKILALHENGLKEKESFQNIYVHRVRLITRGWSKHPIIQLIKYIEFAIRIVKNYHRTDIVHCYSIGPLPISVIIKKLSRGKVKIVYDAREYETEVNGLRGLKKKIVTWLERKLIFEADQVITVSNSIAEEYARRYNISKPTLVLNCPPYQVVPSSDVFRTRFPITPKQKIFLYQGGLTSGRGIELLIQTFSKLSRRDVVLVMMGYGPLESKVRSAAKQYENIFYHPAVSPIELLKYTASADVGIAFIENTCLSYYYCLPNKFFEYSMAGLPLLINNLPEMNRLIQKYGCGVVADGDGNTEALVEAINKIMSKDLKQLSDNALTMAKDYNWEEQEKNLIDVYNRLKL
jgi:glycosyltransferase involved in cell wall biosynthesis